MTRHLASIQTIKDLKPIEGADRIETAQVQGWEVIVTKGDFMVGDKCVFFEIDSLLPKGLPWSVFLEKRKYRVRTIRLRGQLSQGLALPLEDLNVHTALPVGEDVTKILGVTKYDPQAAKEKKEFLSQRKHVPYKWLLRFSLGRRLHQIIWPRSKGSWPEWFPKTDETRVQNIKNLEEHIDSRDLYVTEKLDGQSFTIFYHRDSRVGLLKKGLFGVCSRNIWYKNPTANNWWDIARAYNLQEYLAGYCDNTKQSLAIQGEIVGPRIQKNRYHLSERKLFVFSVYDIGNQRYLSQEEKEEVLSQLGLTAVPLLYLPSERRECDWVAEDFLATSEGSSMLDSTILREGLVWRCTTDDSFSFKSISNKFLEDVED